jgi:hypothetical protein
MQRLKETGQLDPPGHGTKGSLTISDIRLPLKKEFVTKIGTTQGIDTQPLLANFVKKKKKKKKAIFLLLHLN